MIVYDNLHCTQNTFMDCTCVSLHLTFTFSNGIENLFYVLSKSDPYINISDKNLLLNLLITKLISPPSFAVKYHVNHILKINHRTYQNKKIL